MKFKPIIARALLGFVLISIGFVIGKEVTLTRLRPLTTADPASQPTAAGNQVVVYYMHTTIRCVTCNQIEKMASALVDSRFAQAKQSGRLVWREVDFQQDEVLAKRFDVVSSCVVVARTRDGHIVDFQRLDEIWTLSDKPEQFNEYFGKAIQACLDGGPA